MYNSHQIANHFIKSSHATGIELTPMKLIKLCYIAHGWHLGLYDTELLDEAIYAWKFGPVVETLYHDFKKYGDTQIKELYVDDFDGYPLPDEQIKPFLNEIWKVYSKYNGVQLSSMTHQPNTPWYIVWHQQGGNKTNHVIIPNNLIKSHYKDKINSVNGAAATQSHTSATVV